MSDARRRLLLRGLASAAFLAAHAGALRNASGAGLASDLAAGGAGSSSAAARLLAHAAVSALLYLLMRQLFLRDSPVRDAEPAALAGAALFALHPIACEPLNRAAAGPALLAAAAVVGGLLLARGRAGLAAPLWIPLLAAGALSGASVLVFIPLLAALLLVYPERTARTARPDRPSRRAALAGLAIAAAAAPLLEWAAARGRGGPAPLAAPGRLEFLRAQSFAWFHYFRLFALPAGFSPAPDGKPVLHWHDTRVLFGCAFMAAILLAGFAAVRHGRRGRPVLLGALWFCLALLPESALVPSPRLVVDARAYLPAAGLAIAAGGVYLLARRAGRRAGVWFLAWIALLGALSARRHRDWGDPERLWSRAVADDSRNVTALVRLAGLRAAAGDLATARRLAERAYALRPDDGPAVLALADLDAREAHPERAIARLEAALAAEPGDPDLLRGLALARAREGHDRGAIRPCAPGDCAPREPAASSPEPPAARSAPAS